MSDRRKVRTIYRNNFNPGNNNCLRLRRFVIASGQAQQQAEQRSAAQHSKQAQQAGTVLYICGPCMRSYRGAGIA